MSLNLENLGECREGDEKISIASECVWMDGKRVLITGSYGFLGSRAAEYFRERGFELVIPPHKDMDITDADCVNKVLLKLRPNAVIHCAAISDTSVCEREEEASWQVNVLGSENVAGAAYAIGAKCIMCSSDQVYFGSDKREAHVETESLHPANVYGRHKLLAEKKALYVNPECICLRLSWMYDMKSDNTGEHGDFLRTLLYHMQAGKELIYPVFDRRGITYVWEVVRNLEKALDLPGGIYNFGAENQDSTYDTVREVFVRLNMDVQRIYPDKNAFCKKNRNLSMDLTKLGQYGIYFRKTKDALADCLEDFL